jgi:threonine/homoserine/homoserine lactone efflux protein
MSRQGPVGDDLGVPRPSTLALFAATALAILLVPGPAVPYIVTRSVENGRRVGLAGVLGVHLGTLVHIAAAAAGLSALLVSSASAFSVVKYAGAAYLIALGLRRLLVAPPPELDESDQAVRRATSPRSALAQGIAVNVLNPKTALFFLAFLPPFLDPSRGPVAVQVVVLGLVFVAIGLVSDSAYAVTAASLATRLRNRGVIARRGQRASGLVFVGLGVGAALTPRHRAAPRAGLR